MTTRKRWFLALSVIDLYVGFMRWLWRKAHPHDQPWWWAWVIYHVISGYPPGELHHWEEVEGWLKPYPEWLKKHEPWLIPFLHCKNDRQALLELRDWWSAWDKEDFDVDRRPMGPAAEACALWPILGAPGMSG